MLLSRFLLFCAAVMVSSSLSAESFRVVLEPLRRTALSAEITSTVTTIPKRMGEMFKKNEILMTLDDQVYKSNHLKMLAILERAKAELSAQKRLYANRSASLLELREAEAKLAAAQADLTQATKELKACTLLAPYAGEVQDVHVEEFERVEPGKPLIEIQDSQTLVAKLLVPSRVGLSIKVGQKLKIFIPEVQANYTAVVTHVAPGIDPSSSLIKIDSEIDNTNRSLRSGMIGALEITSDEVSP